MTINFLLVSSISLDRHGFLEGMVAAFEARGSTAAVLTGSFQQEHYLIQRSVAVFNLARMGTKQDERDLAGLIRTCEQRYGLSSLRNFCYPEYAYFGEDEEDLVRKAVRYFGAVEQLFSTHAIGCLIQKSGGELIRRVTCAVASARGVPCIFLGESLFPGKILLYDDEEGTIRLQVEDSLSEADSAWVDTFVQSACKAKQLYRYAYYSRDLWGKVASGIEAVKLGDVAITKFAVRQTIRRCFLAPLQRAYEAHHTCREYRGSRYFFFPYHVADDTQLTIRNPQFVDQDSLALYIARSLPQNYKLLVKAHPGTTFTRRSLDTLRRVSNIVPLRNDVNVHQILPGATGVVTINSTVGFESLWYFKPVIVLGQWFMRAYGATIDVVNLRDLPAAIRQAIDEPPCPERVRGLLVALRNAMYDGSIYCEDIDYASVATAVEKHLRGTAPPKVSFGAQKASDDYADA